MVNATPTITFDTSADGAVFSPGELVHLTATDLENSDLGGAVSWTSSLDGALGSGVTLDKGLVASGVHQLTAAVADTDGETASATRTVSVNAAGRAATRTSGRSLFAGSVRGGVGAVEHPDGARRARR